MVRYCVTIQCQYWHLLQILFENGITPSPRISNNRWSPGTFPECLICIISWDCQALTKYLGNAENVIKGWLCLKYKTVQPSNLIIRYQCWMWLWANIFTNWLHWLHCVKNGSQIWSFNEDVQILLWFEIFHIGDRFCLGQPLKLLKHKGSEKVGV